MCPGSEFLAADPQLLGEGGAFAAVEVGSVFKALDEGEMVFCVSKELEVFPITFEAKIFLFEDLVQVDLVGDWGVLYLRVPEIDLRCLDSGWRRHGGSSMVWIGDSRTTHFIGSNKMS